METDGGQGATKVNEDDIIGVVREYIEDKENSYAPHAYRGMGMRENLLCRARTDREAGGRMRAGIPSWWRPPTAPRT